jgi:hypothetical protein
MRYSKTPLFVAMLAATAACDSLERPISGPDPEGALGARAPSHVQDLWNTDLEFARVARAEVPGFAGFYLENDGTPVILLTDPQQRGAAERYLAGQLAAARKGRHASAPQRPTFRTVAHDFAQLKTWFDGLEGLLGREDVYLLDVDEVHNRVFAGVRDEAAIRDVHSEATRIGVPADAIHVEIQPAPERRSTVRDWTSRLAGGYQIQFGPEPWQICTMGFNAYHGGAWKFVTNSHCTWAYFAYDGGTITQPTWFAGNEVGNESNDRGKYACNGWFTSCRKADAAYIQHNHTRTVAQGGIVYTAWNSGGPGGLTVLGEYDVIRRYGGSTPVGTWLDKTGRTTGTTYGQVTQSCVAIGDLRCQDVSTIYSDGGDSGSPIYYWLGNNQVELQGILWGGPQYDPYTTYSSRLAGIEQDLGALAGLCRPGWGC